MHVVFYNTTQTNNRSSITQYNTNQ